MVAIGDSSSLRMLPVTQHSKTQAETACMIPMGMLPLHCYSFFCLFPSQTERVLSTLGLFVLPTVSSLIASSNHETLQYFRASVLCKSCHSFHSLIINILRVSILEMKLGSSPIWKNVVPLTPYK